ncbi:hypothetical protein GGP45_003188 [Salinibacter ruber]|uniref:Uncharacterized protein n=1 Tax=Salinibacter ruber TaxID=146919 RepID=A0A9X2V8F7_9BACT|nr:hypothetical protein [Salinibacter ruber]
MDLNNLDMNDQQKFFVLGLACSPAIAVLGFIKPTVSPLASLLALVAFAGPSFLFFSLCIFCVLGD